MKRFSKYLILFLLFLLLRSNIDTTIAQTAPLPPGWDEMLSQLGQELDGTDPDIITGCLTNQENLGNGGMFLMNIITNAQPNLFRLGFRNVGQISGSGTTTYRQTWQADRGNDFPCPPPTTVATAMGISFAVEAGTGIIRQPPAPAPVTSLNFDWIIVVVNHPLFWPGVILLLIVIFVALPRLKSA